MVTYLCLEVIYLNFLTLKKKITYTSTVCEPIYHSGALLNV